MSEAAVTVIVAAGTLYVIYMIGVAGLTDLSVNVDTSQEHLYRNAVVLENLVSLEATAEELDNTPGTSRYSYDRRRAHIPIEYFSHRKEGEEGLGYKIRNGHCYIDKVTGLDGENFAFSIELLSRPGENAENPKEVAMECVSTLRPSLSAPALLVREDRGNPPLPVSLHVYRVR